MPFSPEWQDLREWICIPPAPIPLRDVLCDYVVYGVGIFNLSDVVNDRVDIRGWPTRDRAAPEED